MVEQGNEPTNREEMKAQLASKAAAFIAERENYKITKSADDGNIECRVNWDEQGRIICIAELKFTPGLTPDDFKYFFENWADNILEVNTLLIKAKVAAVTEGFEVV